MRIAFDATTLRPRKSGVGYYTEHLLHHLSREVKDDEIVLLSNRRVEVSVPLSPGVRVADRYRMPLRNLWMQTFANRLIRDLKPGVAHFTNSVAPLRKRVPTVLTIHDMSLILYPHYHPRRRFWIPAVMSRLSRSVDAIVTDSETMKKDVVRLLAVDPEKVHVVYCAAAPCFRPIESRSHLDEVRHRYSLPQRFLLFVGTIEPRKNLSGLLRAYSALRKRDRGAPSLVLVGALAWGAAELKKEIRHLGLEKCVHTLGYVPYGDLPALYNLAEAFVYPSFYEGFGMPIVEAMACGTPVLSSNCETLEEIAGGAAELVDPSNIESIYSGLRRLVMNDDLRVQLRQKALVRATEFSWAQAARQMLQLYHQVAD